MSELKVNVKCRTFLEYCDIEEKVRTLIPNIKFEGKRDLTGITVTYFLDSLEDATLLLLFTTGSTIEY